MGEFIELMTKPFIACLILTGIHAYLGLHVIERGVIFVDLALAQVAALGATVGFLLGFGLHSTGGYFTALIFTVIGAGVFAMTRARKQVVPQEALIGVVYAVASAASILVLSRAPEGGEELKSLMVGHLLFVDWPEISKMAMLYSIVALVHWFARRPFLAISRDPRAAYEAGYNVRVWDFLFYASFGFVVTSSVEIAGVLLVFSFLIVPSICALLLAEGLSGRLFVAWTIGALVSVAGVWGSYWFDLPTGASVVCTFGLALPLVGAISRLRGVKAGGN